MGDIVPGLDAGLGGWCIVGGRHHLHRTVFGGDGEAKTRIFAIGRLLQIGVIAAIQITRVRIKAGQHAIDGTADQRLVVHLVHIGHAHPLEHVHQRVEFLVGIGFGGGLHGGISRHQRQSRQRQRNLPALVQAHRTADSRMNRIRG